MGINVERSLKRISCRVNNAIVHQKKQIVKGLANKEVRVSDLNKSTGLTESNALTNVGVEIIRTICTELESQVARETGVNKDDAFSNGTVPPISLVDYFGRLARYVNIWRGHAGGAESSGVRAAVMTVIYLDRLQEVGYVLNRENIHRISMAAFLVATKFTEDTPLSNGYWAKVAGVPANEVNMLESAFCKLLSFELFIHDKQYHSMLDRFDLPDF